MNIKIKTISRLSLVVTTIVLILFLTFYIQGENKFHLQQEISQTYTECKDAAIELQSASDYLTAQARLFALSGNTAYIDAYLAEVNMVQRREHALEKLESYLDQSGSVQLLHDALGESEALMSTEYYSMKLILTANSVPDASVPEELQTVVLAPSDLNLTAAEMIQKGQSLVSSEDYLKHKNYIAEKVNACIADLLTDVQDSSMESAHTFLNIYHILTFSIIPMVFMMFASCWIINKQIVKPLSCYSTCIKNGMELPLMGHVVELHSLVRVYNHFYKESRETQRDLYFQLQHDALTEVYNRGAFDLILSKYKKEEKKYALAILDIDFFKRTNDTYGHMIGDRMLQKAAKILQNEFRESDFVCRLGGDEFAVFIADLGSAEKGIIKKRFQHVNERLMQKSDSLPQVSVSVGVAFSSDGFDEDFIYQNADTALYYVKKNGKSGCAFYQPDTPIDYITYE